MEKSIPKSCINSSIVSGNYNPKESETFKNAITTTTAATDNNTNNTMVIILIGMVFLNICGTRGTKKDKKGGGNNWVS